jgi:YHS domain-containing protein
VTRALILGASLLALAACSTHDNLLAPDREADRLISPESRSDYERRGVDPVCGAPLDDVHDVWHATHEGVRYAFHSEACRKQFQDNPEFYSDTVR